ncbi:hypothetical protein CY0110_15170 [Crocosphaera chwakensis CCY0110]|uniref:Transposase n=2 Tax=Crocosphaera TaxID=263510 RepID=A3IU03_9CHRO|nr:hypothetical protein CY0110_30805 [Crocosphaera chwakensis CCY0110]EAZ90098.1 hypothetical protein CY0110_15170 [Crocosphaera chwakensis CCY0110]
MPLSRQLRYEKECRQKWKENAAKKQEKIRQYVEKTRTLKKSRDRWRTKAQKSQQQVRFLEQKVYHLELELFHLKQQLASSTTTSSSEDTTPPSDPDDLDEHSPSPFHHRYSLSTISISVKQVILAGHSYQGASTSISIFSSPSSPHSTTIKSWVERLGLYELQRPKEKRDDWIFIADLTLELGQEKAFVIYGIPYQYWSTHVLSQRRALTYTDGQILALEVTTEATGEWIESILHSLSFQIGTPLQIISDHGSNLKKGIQLFQSYHPRLYYTYDVTHAMANLLEKQLFSDDLFPQFLSDCHHCLLQVQQTEFAFASPPPQRSQCRFFNLDPLLHWARTMLSIPLTLLFQLLPHYPTEHISRRFFEKFSWLFPYQKHIQLWSTLLHMTRSIETIVKTQGLNSSSLFLFHKSLSSLDIPPCLFPFKHQLFNYFYTQLSSHPPYPLLATSDILESLFGRYKYFSKRCPLKELRSLLLTIPLSTVNLTPQFIKDALMTVSNADLSQWVNHTFGQSMLSKRKSLFSF